MAAAAETLAVSTDQAQLPLLASWERRLGVISWGAPPTEGFGVPASKFAGLVFDVSVEPAGTSPAAKRYLAELGHQGVEPPSRVRPPDVISSATGTRRHATGSQDPLNPVSHCNNNEGDVIQHASGGWRYHAYGASGLSRRRHALTGYSMILPFWRPRSV